MATIRPEKSNELRPDLTKQIAKKKVHHNEKHEIKLTRYSLRRPLKKRLDALVMKFETNEYDTMNKNFQMLDRVMKPFQKVRKIEILCSRGGFLGDKDLETLSKGIQRLNSLQSIRIDFLNRMQFTDEYLETLGKGLEKLRSLQSINFDLHNCDWVTDETLNTLSQILKRFSCLQSITMDLSICHRIKDKGLGYLFQGLKRLRSLKSINMNFEYCERITDKGLKNLSQCLQRLDSLQSISMNFENCYGIRCLSLDNFNINLEIFTLLKSLNFNCKGCSMNEDKSGNTLCLCQILQFFTSLQSVNLSFANCINITHQGSSLGSLKSFSFSLKNCPRIIDSDPSKINHGNEYP